MGGAKFRYLFSLGMLVVPAMGALAIAAPYRVRRLTSFTDPWADPFNDGFQLAGVDVHRSWRNLRRGPRWRRYGLFCGAHTDFILSVIGGEFRFHRVATRWSSACSCWPVRLPDRMRAMEMGRGFAGYCAFGVGLWISLQALGVDGREPRPAASKGPDFPAADFRGGSEP
ncbi:MAG: FtsW/RodA/SpoVE family cell cycle protein [Rhodanobacteraceae bacterium]|nr:FtsW/RodA/SpoVE family cell cycle protein [Rhodanobacteraceae bacterium]